MTGYEKGFLTKCAEHGLDVGASLDLLEKQALKVPGAGAARRAGKAVGDVARKVGGKVKSVGRDVAEGSRKYWGDVSGKTARKAKAVSEEARLAHSKAVDDAASAGKRLRNASMEAEMAENVARTAKTPREKFELGWWENSSKKRRNAASREYTDKLHTVGYHRHEAEKASKGYASAKTDRDVARLKTGLGVGMTGMLGLDAKYLRDNIKRRRENREKQAAVSDMYLKGFAEKCAERGLDADESAELLKRAYHVGPFRGVNGKAGDTGFSAGIGPGTAHAGIYNPSRGGFAITGHASRELNHNAASGAVVGALLGLLRERFRDKDEKKHYLRSALLGSLLGGGAGGAYTMATSAPSAVDAVSGLLGKAKGKVDQAGDAMA